jgi:hypothetical protein
MRRRRSDEPTPRPPKQRPFRGTPADLVQLQVALEQGTVVAYDPVQGDASDWPFTDHVAEVLVRAIRSATLSQERLTRYQGAFEEAVPKGRRWAYLARHGTGATKVEPLRVLRPVDGLSREEDA